jgi:Spy/CpxP family protein refolding chaperone
MKKPTTTFLMLAGLFVFVGSSLAQPRQGAIRERSFRRPRQGRILMILKAKQEELNITDEQLDKIKGLQLQQDEAIVAHKNKMNELRLEMKKLMMEESRDYEKIKTLLAKTSDSRNEMFITRLKHREEVLSVLTPEQKEALKAAVKDRPGRGRGFLRDRQGKRLPANRRGIKR